MTREDGLKEIDGAPWERDAYGALNLLVHDKDGEIVHAWLTQRPAYCDRGHLKLNIDMRGKHGVPELNEADSFPRYFFSFTEADVHTRIFLKWRLWKERTISDAEVRSAFE